MPIPMGAAVRQVARVIEGTIVERRFNDAGDMFEYLVTYKDGAGAEQSRWFTDGQIEEVAQ
jgi:hypothetical protein